MALLLGQSILFISSPLTCIQMYSAKEHAAYAYIVHALSSSIITLLQLALLLSSISQLGKRKFDFSPFGTCNFSPIALVGNYQILILLFTSK